MAAPNRQEAESSPFVERLLRKGYEVLYLVEPVDEYCIQVSKLMRLLLASVKFALDSCTKMYCIHHVCFFIVGLAYVF